MTMIITAYNAFLNASERVFAFALSNLDALIFSSTNVLDGGWSASGGLVLLFLLLALLLLVVVTIVGVVALVVIWIRYRTKHYLESCGLPTILWRPKYMTYGFEAAMKEELLNSNNNNSTCHSASLGIQYASVPAVDDEDAVAAKVDLIDADAKKLSSSKITNILPRMKRLNGPYGMYGTVYGVSTKVVNVAHPIPAAAILANSTSMTVTTTGSSSSSSTGSQQMFATTGASKAPTYNHFKDFFGDGVFTAEGADWKAKRAAVLHALLMRNKKESFEDKVGVEANRAFERFVRQVEKPTTTTNTTTNTTTRVKTNIVPLLQKTTIGLIFRYMTDCDIDVALSELHNDGTTTTYSKEKLKDATSKNNNESLSQSTPSSSSPLLSAYLRSITRIRMIISAQSRSIWFLLPRWFYKTFSSMYKEEERTTGPIRTFASLACERANPGSPLSDLIKHKVYRQEEKSETAGSSFSKNMLDEAVTLLFAGQDTSAATLSWTLHLLSLYPAAQEKLAKEVRSSLAGMDDDEDFSSVMNKKFLSKLTYMDAVIKEAMRLYPVAPFVVRRMKDSVTLRVESNSTATADNEKGVNSSSSLSSAVTLPKGGVACIWIYALQRNPLFWNRPDDFVPERWLEQSPDRKDIGITNGAYMPFAVGPRNCVGQPLAHIILRTLLARLVNRYNFRDDRLKDGMDPAVLRKDMQAGFTVLPIGGVDLIVEKCQ